MTHKKKSKTDAPDTRRRSLSGCFIFDTLPQDKRRRPTCVEDCTEETRIKWLKTKNHEFLKNLGQVLNETFEGLWRMLRPEEQRTLMADLGEKPFCETYKDLGMEIHEINRFCKQLRALADWAGIYNQGSEADPNHKPEDDE